MTVHHALRFGSLVISLSLLFTGASRAQGPVVESKLAALVNNEPISLNDLKGVLDSRPQTVPLTEAQQREVRLGALDMMIDDILMRQFLRQNAPPLNPTELEKAWNELKNELSKTKKTLADLARDTHQTEEQVKGDLAARLQWKGYLVAKIPETELKSYYQANKVFFDKTFVQASHILVKAGNQPGDRQKAHEKVEYLRQEIMAGKISFEDAAEKYSDCPSKRKKGDLGPFPYKFVVVEPIAKAAFTMQVGDVSSVIATDYGMHIIKVTRIIPGQPSVYENIRETVREVYAQDLELYQKILAEQRKRADIKIYLPK